MTTNLKLVVDPKTGEVLEPACPDCKLKNDELAGLEDVIRRQGARIQLLLRDADAAARAHELWPMIEELFKLWRRETKHPRSAFTVDRFEIALPFVRNKAYGPAMVERGIRGIAFDHFSKPNRAGHVERYDGWEILFKSAGNFERYCNRAPR
jgi:hypothetical protein